MDEPFSAVDPVVRESLQDELLKLQAELGKTIVFVTHDIDEAVKLGDRVAVFRVGGKLAQYDEPGVLLARPADDFVDGFVGRDRGYRGLSFLLLRARCRCASCAPPGAGERTEQGWTLVLDADGRPLGWHHDRAGGATVDAKDLVPGGSLYDTGSGSLRSALDAALSSPSGQGVAVDGDGRAVGCGRRGRRAGRAGRRPARRGGLRRAWGGCAAGQPPADRRPHAGAPVLRAAPDRDRARARDPAGVAGQPDPRSAARSTINIAGLLYTIPSLALFVLLPAAAGHAHPGPDQRDRRADRLHRRAARPHGRGRAQRRPPGGRQLGDRDGVHVRCAGSPLSSCRCRSRSWWPGCGWPRCRTSASSRSVR